MIARSLASSSLGLAFGALVLLFPSQAEAGELVWEGFYRARALGYDSLSLSDTNAQAEGSSAFFDHRMSLRPKWILSEHATVHAQLDVLAYTLWGDAPATYADTVTGETIAMAQTDGVATTGAGIEGVRAWAEVFSSVGRFAAGRMPMQWGAGILWNDGNKAWNEYGDTADRFQFNTRAGPVFVMAAFDVQYEGFIGDGLNAEGDSDVDDMQSLSLAVGYRSETAGVGLLNNYRYQPKLDYQAYTADLWGYTELGPVRIELEGIGVFGAGSLDSGANDISISAFGAMLDARYTAEKIGFGLEAGVATGDEDPTDAKITTFSFDRDHDVALLLFEEPLPTLATTVQNETNQGRTTEAAISGDGVSNALYLRPSVRYRFLPGLEAEALWITAARAKNATTATTGDGYGHEFDLSVRYDPYPHVWVKGTFGVLLPGSFYSEHEHEDLGSGFESTAVGGRILGTVEF